MKTRKNFLCLLMTLFFLTGLQTASLSSATGEKAVPTKASEVPRITPVELKSLLARGVNVLIVDARSHEEYIEAHIPGALSIEEFHGRYQKFSKETKVVLY
jgi:3-mercaptopyruvate sulfurtransferase SseA